MRTDILNITALILAFFVLALSIGASISKMKCSKDGNIYFGTEVPNSMQERDFICSLNSTKLSCCKEDILLKSCCPQTEDNSCASETINLQFDFETLVGVYELSIDLVPINLFNLFIHSDIKNLFEKILYYPDKLPPLYSLIIYFQVFLL